jgi:hypothetical protein
MSEGKSGFAILWERITPEQPTGWAKPKNRGIVGTSNPFESKEQCNAAIAANERMAPGVYKFEILTSEEARAKMESWEKEREQATIQQSTPVKARRR